MKFMNNAAGRRQVFIPVFIFSLLCTVLLLTSCKKDYYKPFIHTWVISAEEVTLVLKPDSSFTFTERNNPPRTGIWNLNEDGTSIIFNTGGKHIKMLKVKEISDKKLILTDYDTNLDQDYVLAE